MKENLKPKRKTWSTPWGYRESALVSGGILLIGLLLEYVAKGQAVYMPEWPYNLMIGIIYSILIINLFVFFRNNNTLRWLSGIPASIGSICLFTFLVLAMGLIPQVSDNKVNELPLGFSNILHSWQFILASLFLMTTLSLVTLRRSIPFRKNTPAFLINHFGLWLIVFSVSLGSADLQRYQMILEEGKTTNIGYNADGSAVQFSFSVDLIDFRIDEFPAKLAVVDKNTNQIIVGIKNNMALIEKGKFLKIGNLAVKIIDYLPMAIPDSNKRFHVSSDSLAAPAAHILVIDKINHTKYLGWISSGSPKVASQYMAIGADYLLAITIPSPKRFSSLINIHSAKTNLTNVKLEVNKPYKVNGWKLYQTGFNEEMGKYSTTSIVEVVNDPWIPVVYTGIFLMLIGAVYMFWIGKETKIN